MMSPVTKLLLGQPKICYTLLKLSPKLDKVELLDSTLSSFGILIIINIQGLTLYFSIISYSYTKTLLNYGGRCYKWNWLWRRKHRNNVKVVRVTKARAGVQTNRLLVWNAWAAGVYDTYFIVPLQRLTLQITPSNYSTRQSLIFHRHRIWDIYKRVNKRRTLVNGSPETKRINTGRTKGLWQMSLGQNELRNRVGKYIV